LRFLDVSETSSAGGRLRRRKQSGLRSSPAPRFAYNGDGVRTSKTVAGDTTEYVLDLAAALPVVISDTEAVYLYGLDIIAQQQLERDSGPVNVGPKRRSHPLDQSSPMERQAALRGW